MSEEVLYGICGLFLCVMVPGAYAQDYLEPHPGLSNGSDYEQTLGRLFQKGYQHTHIMEREAGGATAILRVTIIPSSVLVAEGSGSCISCEVMTGVRMIGDSTRYEVFALTSDRNVWHEGWEPGAEPGTTRHWDWEGARAERRVRVEEASTAFDADLARRMLRLWKDVLLCPRYPEDTEIFGGGVQMVFSAFVMGRGRVGGAVSHPDEGSLTWGMLTIGRAMEAYAKAGEVDQERLLAELRDEVARLERRLTEHGRCAAARTRR